MGREILGVEKMVGREILRVEKMGREILGVEKMVGREILRVSISRTVNPKGNYKWDGKS